MIVRADLAGGSERGLEVVVFLRKIVPVARGLRLLEGGAAFGVHSAVIHVVAGEISAGAELDEDDGLDVSRVDADAPVIAAHHASADLTGEEGIAGGVGRIAGLAAAAEVGGDADVGAQRSEAEVRRVGVRHWRYLAVPETLGVGAVERKQFAERHGRAGIEPAGAGVERGVEAGLDGEALDGEQMFGGSEVFVFYLEGDDGAALFPEQTGKLGRDRFEVAAHDFEICGIVGAGAFAEAFDHPVRQAAVAHLAVAPRAEADDGGQAKLAHGGDETPEISLA